jgi:hypothetical protein
MTFGRGAFPIFCDEGQGVEWVQNSYRTHGLCRSAAEVWSEIYGIRKILGRGFARNRQHSCGVGRGLKGRGHGFNKGPITVAMRVSGSQNGPFVPLISITYALKVHCHGRGRGFEPRRPRH